MEIIENGWLATRTRELAEPAGAAPLHRGRLAVNYFGGPVSSA